MAECHYDYGDCCYYENDRSLCEECFCFADPKQMKDIHEGLCYDPGNLIVKYELGNGWCDIGYNRPEFNFDVGDCCLENAHCRIEYKDARPWVDQVPMYLQIVSKNVLIKISQKGHIQNISRNVSFFKMSHVKCLKNISFN